jgi:hypothetical protein
MLGRLRMRSSKETLGIWHDSFNVAEREPELYLQTLNA